MNARWLLLMAWRDSRRNRSRLFLFIASIVIGIAALVAIRSFGDNLQQEIDRQAASLLGADLALESTRPLPDTAQLLIDSLIRLSAAHAEEQRFASMLRFLKNDGSRLIQVRAIQGSYPFYGQLETVPASAALTFQQGREVLVDHTLLLQFQAQVGDSVQLGNIRLRIAGALISTPGQSVVSASIAPIVFMPGQLLDQSGLLQKGSRITYRRYLQFPSRYPVDQLVDSLEQHLDQLNLRAETIASTKENTGRSFSDLTDFLGLIGFIALLLGSLGVSSAVQIYVKEKIPSVAILRCLGVNARQTFLIYLIQIVGIGFIGGVLGALLGASIQQILPWVLQDFLPMDVEYSFSGIALLQGVSTGICMAILSALLPLLHIRLVPPLFTLRVNSLTKSSWRFDYARWIVVALLLVFLVCFTYVQLHQWLRTLAFLCGTGLALLFLYGTSQLLIQQTRKHIPASWPFVWRQGLANLFRPNNQTVLLTISIGLGTALIASLFFMQHMLIQRVNGSASTHQPNMVLFDIQTKQKEAVVALTKAHQLPVLEEVPVVTMQLHAIKGYTAAQAREDSSLQIPQGAYRGEIRATYRDTSSLSEKIVRGKWAGQTKRNEAPHISLDRRYAERLGVTVGDSLSFNVQGRVVPAVVGSLREVDWNRMQTNFRVVFPLGVIDHAPQFHVIMTRISGDEQAARFQQEVVNQFPNISVIDLKLVLQILDSLLDKIRFVIEFMGSFSLVTGLVVLISSILISKFQRIRENVLLRTLGAQTRQIWWITGCEYTFLGFLATLAGLLLAVIAGFFLALFLFETDFSLPWPVIGSLLLGIPGLTVGIGLLNSRSTWKQSPLEVLRKEG